MPCASVSANRTLTSVEKQKPSTSASIRPQQRKVILLPEELRVEARFPEPSQLDVGRIWLVVAVAQRGDLHVGGDDVGQDEPAARSQRVVHPCEELLLLAAIQMVNGERGDDEVEQPRR